MDTFVSLTELVEKGEYTREKLGDCTGALELFRQAQKRIKSVSDEITVLGQLALTYWQLGKYTAAEELCDELIQLGQEQSSRRAVAVAHRHLSREGITKDPSERVRYAENGHYYALASGEESPDITWFSHGVFNAVLGYSFWGTIKWLLIETLDLLRFRSWLSKDSLSVRLSRVLILLVDWLSPWGVLSLPPTLPHKVYAGKDALTLAS